MQPGILEGLAKGLLFTFVLADTFCDAANVNPADLACGQSLGKKGCTTDFYCLDFHSGSQENQTHKG